jgi:hypothetical protein
LADKVRETHDIPTRLMTDPDTFEKRWKSHVQDLERLRLGIDAEHDDFDRVKELKDELDEIVERTADSFRND